MATVETTTKTITCDVCNATIDPKDQRLLNDDLELAIGYFIDQVNTINVRPMKLRIPYGKCRDVPDLCRNCTAKFLKKALDRVTRRIESTVKAE